MRIKETMNPLRLIYLGVHREIYTHTRYFTRKTNQCNPTRIVWGRVVNKVNLSGKFSLFSEHWTPKIIAELNDYQIKIAKVEGDFVWHNHSDTDEFFLVIEGTLFIEFESETMELKTGELCVVPKGVQHRPYAKEECRIMLIEPRGVVNTGDAESELRASNDVWI